MYRLKSNEKDRITVIREIVYACEERYGLDKDTAFDLAIYFADNCDHPTQCTEEYVATVLWTCLKNLRIHTNYNETTDIVYDVKGTAVTELGW